MPVDAQDVTKIKSNPFSSFWEVNYAVNDSKIKLKSLFILSKGQPMMLK